MKKVTQFEDNTKDMAADKKGMPKMKAPKKMKKMMKKKMK